MVTIKPPASDGLSVREHGPRMLCISRKGNEIEQMYLSIEEAHELHRQLAEIFETKEENARVLGEE